MEAQCLAKSEMTLPREEPQIELINLAEQVRYREQSSIDSIIMDELTLLYSKTEITSCKSFINVL